MTKILFILLFVAAAASAALQSDIEYGKAGDVSLKLDAWVPDGKGPFPTVIIVHGGGWQNGDKQTNCKPLFDPLTRAGFAWFTINYRLAPAHTYPAAVEDVVAAIKWVEAHAKEYKVDKKRMALTGESAGGHLVSLVGARDGRKLHLAAVIPFYAPNDLEPMVLGQDKTPGAVRAITQFLGIKEPYDGGVKLMHEASPVTYVQKRMPPFLIIHGTGDPLVKFRQAELMCDKVKVAGSSCEVYRVEGAGHGMNGWERNPGYQRYKQKVVEWLQKTMH